MTTGDNDSPHTKVGGASVMGGPRLSCRCHRPLQHFLRPEDRGDPSPSIALSMAGKWMGGGREGSQSPIGVVGAMRKMSTAGVTHSRTALECISPHGAQLDTDASSAIGEVLGNRFPFYDPSHRRFPPHSLEPCSPRSGSPS